MAMCPLLRKECIGEQCAWWYEGGSELSSRCVIASLPYLLDEVVDEVSEVSATLDAGITVYT